MLIEDDASTIEGGPIAVGMTTIIISGLHGDPWSGTQTAMKLLKQNGIAARLLTRTFQQGGLVKVDDSDVERALEVLREAMFLGSVLPP
jgi:hypothetical protein